MSTTSFSFPISHALKRPSTKLFIFSAFLLCLCAVMIFFVHRTIDKLHNDAMTINKTGVVRGSIQRVTKLMIAGKRQSADEIILDINNLLKKFAVKDSRYGKIFQDKEMADKLNRLKRLWKDLEFSLYAYTVHPSPQLKTEIIRKSEECWDVADATVLAVQIANEYKVGKMKLFYVILAMNAAAAFIVIWLVYTFVRNKLENQAYYDPLTNVLNKRSFDSALGTTMERCKRYGRELSLIMFDIDYFKRINDVHGHKVGDKVLVELTKLVNHIIRSHDSLFRVGGEEFTIIVPETPVGEVYKLAERVRTTVESHTFGPVQELRISLGISGFAPGMTKADMFVHADQALYQAKMLGRNQTYVYAHEEEG